MNKLFGLCLKLLILYSIKPTKCEIFTSLIEVEELFETESVLINNLEEFILVQEKKVEYFKLKIQDSKRKRKHQVAGTNVTLYISNPIITYILKKRLTSDWKYLGLGDLISHYNGSSFLENVRNYRNILKFPSIEDLNGAAEALLRLQDTYNLETSSIAKGELNGVQYSTEMTSSDCFVLGVHSALTGDDSHTVLWMDEAMNRFVFEPKNNINSNINAALKLLMKLRDVMPYDKNYVFEKPIKYVEPDLEYDACKNSKDKLYKMMCRNELEPTSRQIRPLRCHYVSNHVPFLKIAPLKRETASISPYIVIYHEVMYDNEIELVKEMAKPRFIRAFVGSLKTGLLKTGSFFIAKRALIQTEENKIIQNLLQRTEDMTGLNMETTQELEVVNYGIGGQYAPHYDFIDKGGEEGSHNGNRIASVLFYMSDVEQGGATVFPATKTVIFPKRGTAVFWYNLYTSGEVDYRTKHAGCPVLSGSKWVLNNLIEERGQEFRRRCDVIKDQSTHLEE